MILEQYTLNPERVLGRWTLIVGEVNTGKTTLSRSILERLCEKVCPGDIAVIDLAPDIPEELAERRSKPGAGGKLIPSDQRTVYLHAPIRPPRLSTDTEEEALAVAEENIGVIDTLFDTFRRHQRTILFINDISLYLQAGEASRIIDHLKSVPTLVANGYYGRELGTGILSYRERCRMEALMGFFTQVLRLEERAVNENWRGEQ